MSKSLKSSFLLETSRLSMPSVCSFRDLDYIPNPTYRKPSLNKVGKNVRLITPACSYWLNRRDRSEMPSRKQPNLEIDRRASLPSEVIRRRRVAEKHLLPHPRRLAFCSPNVIVLSFYSYARKSRVHQNLLAERLFMCKIRGSTPYHDMPIFTHSNYSANVPPLPFSKD